MIVSHSLDYRKAHGWFHIRSASVLPTSRASYSQPYSMGAVHVKQKARMRFLVSAATVSVANSYSSLLDQAVEDLSNVTLGVGLFAPSGYDNSAPARAEGIV